MSGSDTIYLVDRTFNNNNKAVYFGSKTEAILHDVRLPIVEFSKIKIINKYIRIN